MQRAFGLNIPQTLEEVCDPNRLALIVYDMQVGIVKQIDHAKPVTDKVNSDPALTVTSTGCPGVVIERAVQVTGTELLWVQVRGDDEATARDVLGSVRTRNLY